MGEVRACVGFSNLRNSRQAGAAAAAQALDKAGTGSLVLAFCGGKHDYDDCFAGIRSVSGDLPIVGGAAIGIITNDHLGYEGHEVGVAVLPADLRWKLAVGSELGQDEARAGRQLGLQLADQGSTADELILLFYDSIKQPPPPAPVLNVSTHLLDGLRDGLGAELPPPIVGAGLVGSYNFDQPKLFCGERVEQQCAVAAQLSGDYAAFHTVMHGCKPISDYHTITRVEGAVVYEIDGKPASKVIDELLGDQQWQERLPLLTVTLGVNHGEKYAPYDESQYVNRLIVGVIPEDQALVLFEADFSEGSKFQFMQRNAEMMRESATLRCQEALAQLESEGGEPILALYIDCAGRTNAFSGAEVEEASIVQDIIGSQMPLLGFYSGVEIAPLLGQSRGLDWTGVVLVLTTKS